MFHSLSDIISRYVCILSTIDSPSTFQYVLLSRDAKVPKRATQESAGYDIYSPKVVTIPARSTVKIPLDLSITPPPGTYVRTAARSSMATKHQIICPADVVDPDYTGCIHMCLTNLSEHQYTVQKHERIGSIVFECYATPAGIETFELDSTARGAKGFGSTGRM
jgi:dUTP pyrophosphatase